MCVVSRFSSVTCGGRPIQICDPASDSDLIAVWKYFQAKVDYSLDSTWTTWNDFDRNNPKTSYHIEYFKINIKRCSCGIICMPMNVWETLVGRPRFLPFPMPASENAEEYNSYDLVKGVETNASLCPSAKNQKM